MEDNPGHVVEEDNPGLVMEGRLGAGLVGKDRTALVVAVEGGLTPIGRKRKHREGGREREREIEITVHP